MSSKTGQVSPTEGFTLVEILIVVLILGILGSIVIPRFSNASETARANMLADNIRMTRMQIAVFRAQHRGIAPGYPNCDPTQAPSEEAFIAHMTQASDEDGNTAAPGTPGFRYGPYFREIAENPVNGKSTVQVLADAAPFPGAGDDSHGYVYKPATLVFKADLSGTDPDGVPFFDY